MVAQFCSVIIAMTLAVFADASVPLKSSEFPLQGCAGDWKEFEGHCYKLVSNVSTGEGMDIAKSLVLCKQVGPFVGVSTALAYLADIYSQAENDFVSEVVAKGERAWLGMSRLGSNGPFYWITRDDTMASEITEDSFKYWKPNEPNNSGGDEDCAEINRGPPGRWNDLPCQRKRPGVCKYEIALVGAKI